MTSRLCVRNLDVSARPGSDLLGGRRLQIVLSYPAISSQLVAGYTALIRERRWEI